MNKKYFNTLVIVTLSLIINISDSYTSEQSVEELISEFSAPDDVNELKRIAEIGLARPQLILGWMYYLGVNIEQDYREAFYWFSKAADQGQPNAMMAIAMMYDKGIGTHQDYVLAHMWANLAVAYGLSDAVKYRDEIALSMSSKQLEEAQTLVRKRNTNTLDALELDKKINKYTNTKMSLRTGIYVSDSGHIITTAYKLSECDEIRDSGQNIIDIISADEKNDLALLKTNIRPFSGTVIFSHLDNHKKNTPLKIAQVTDYILSTRISLVPSELLEYTESSNDSSYITLSSPSESEYGGEAILSDNGVIGLITTKPELLKNIKNLNKIQNVKVGVTHTKIKEFLYNNNIKYKESNSTDSLDWPYSSGLFVTDLWCLVFIDN